jgi:murein DD-endopeptidase MepM/ murein hydrolase activator NlpD
MNRYPKNHTKTAIIATLCLLVFISVLAAMKNSDPARMPVSLSIKPNETLSNAVVDVPVSDKQIPTPITNDTPLEPVSDQWVTVSIRRGDSLASIFKRAGLSPKDLHDIMSLGSKVKSLKKILPKKEVKFKFDVDGQLAILNYVDSPLRSLQVKRNGDGYEAQWLTAETETLTAYKTASITADKPSLYHAGKAAGLSDNMIMKLSNVFQWDISFALDMRQGDSFAVLYEDIYVDGEKVKEGEIIAAQFLNMGKTYQAVRYTDEKNYTDYYAKDGASLRKAFIRDPVHFSHVSSSFNLRRLHPIHKKVMPHRGIDYAANKGTPVLAAGDGKVTITRQNNASGRYIVVQHGQQYTTKYLHLSAFAKGIRAGKTVKQGQTIGYVGETGWATAPHLHYEFLVNGVHRNPRTVKLPKAEPISKEGIKRFQTITRPTLVKLDSIIGNRTYAYAPLED